MSADERCSRHIEARGDELIVTMPGCTFRAVYRKPHRGPQLIPKLDYFQDEQTGPIARWKFVALARRLAADKARELGWIV
jgi:hypothetical protein